MSTTSPSRINIDDTDPRISYTGSWTAGIGTGGLEFNNTFRVSRVAGSTATVNFEGDFIEVYGSVRKRNSPVGTPNPISSYTLEDGTSVTFTPVETDSNHFRTLFFEKRGLESGNHTLVVQNLVQDDFLFLDYFVVGASGGGGGGDGNSGPIGDSIANPQPQNSNPTSINVGTIVGIVIGTMAITLLAVLVGFFCWQKIRRRGQKGAGPGPVDEETNYVTQEFTRDQHLPGYPFTPLDRLSSSFDPSLTTGRHTTTPHNISHDDTAIHSTSQQGPTPFPAPFHTNHTSSKMLRILAGSIPYEHTHRQQQQQHRNEGFRGTMTPSPPVMSRTSVGQQSSDLSYDGGRVGGPLAPPPY